MTQMRDLSQFQAQLIHNANLMEGVLADCLTKSVADDAAEARAERLLDAMRYAALGGGKRIRPFLVLETAALFGAADKAAFAGAALEFVHCYSLVHDDLPAMDDDDLRRGKPTVHKKFDDATAVLTGDALLTLAFEVMTGDLLAVPSGLKPDVHLALSFELARAAAKMAQGQMLDLAAEGRFSDWVRQPLKLTRREVEALQDKKTGALIRCAVRMGALIGGATDSEMQALTRYAEHLGLAFQIADDLIDAEGDAATAGKATAKDLGRGKATLVSLEGIPAAKALLDAVIAKAEACLAPFGTKAEMLRDAVHFMALRRS